ncbi:MAG: hypothetical protein ACREPP_09995 [Rhodanobacteraceae bacterium]
MIDAAPTHQIDESFLMGAELYHRSQDRRGDLSARDFDTGATAPTIPCI